LAGGGGEVKKEKLSEETNYNKRLQPYANKLRKEMTKSEACLWKYALKSGKMCGYSFSRQRPVLGYIADFMCKELKLIIELDGATHEWKDVMEKDIKRQKDLEKAGFFVMRFTDSDVLNAIDSVVSAIKKIIKEIEKRFSHPRLPRQAPPPAGDTTPITNCQKGISSSAGEKSGGAESRCAPVFAGSIFHALRELK